MAVSEPELRPPNRSGEDPTPDCLTTTVDTMPDPGGQTAMDGPASAPKVPIIHSPNHRQHAEDAKVVKDGASHAHEFEDEDAVGGADSSGGDGSLGGGKRQREEDEEVVSRKRQKEDSSSNGQARAGAWTSGEDDDDANGDETVLVPEHLRALAETLADPNTTQGDKEAAIKTIMSGFQSRLEAENGTKPPTREVASCSRECDARYNKKEAENQELRRDVLDLEEDKTSLEQEVDALEQGKAEASFFRIPQDNSSHQKRGDFKAPKMETAEQYGEAFQLLQQVLLRTTNMNDLTGDDRTIDLARFDRLGFAHQDKVWALISILQDRFHYIMWCRYHRDVTSRRVTNLGHIAKSRWVWVLDPHAAHPKRCSPGDLTYVSGVFGGQEVKLRPFYVVSHDEYHAVGHDSYTGNGQGTTHLPQSVIDTLVPIHEYGRYGNDERNLPDDAIVVEGRRVEGQNYLSTRRREISLSEPMARGYGGLVPHSDALLKVLSFKQEEKLSALHGTMAAIPDEIEKGIKERLAAKEAIMNARQQTAQDGEFWNDPQSRIGPYPPFPGAPSEGASSGPSTTYHPAQHAGNPNPIPVAPRVTMHNTNCNINVSGDSNIVNSSGNNALNVNGSNAVNANGSNTLDADQAPRSNPFGTANPLPPSRRTNAGGQEASHRERGNGNDIDPAGSHAATDTGSLFRRADLGIGQSGSQAHGIGRDNGAFLGAGRSDRR